MLMFYNLSSTFSEQREKAGQYQVSTKRIVMSLRAWNSDQLGLLGFPTDENKSYNQNRMLERPN